MEKNRTFFIYISERKTSPYGKDDDRLLRRKQEEEMDPCDVALIWLLQQANCLKQYFLKHETDQLKKKLKEMKKDPLNKQLANMIDYVSDMAAVIAAAVIVAVN